MDLEVQYHLTERTAQLPLLRLRKLIYKEWLPISAKKMKMRMINFSLWVWLIKPRLIYSRKMNKKIAFTKLMGKSKNSLREIGELQGIRMLGGRGPEVMLVVVLNRVNLYISNINLFWRLRRRIREMSRRVKRCFNIKRWSHHMVVVSKLKTIKALTNLVRLLTPRLPKKQRNHNSNHEFLIFNHMNNKMLQRILKMDLCWDRRMPL